jgi:hypothetical protein
VNFNTPNSISNSILKFCMIPTLKHLSRSYVVRRGNSLSPTYLFRTYRRCRRGSESCYNKYIYNMGACCSTGEEPHRAGALLGSGGGALTVSGNDDRNDNDYPSMKKKQQGDGSHQENNCVNGGSTALEHPSINSATTTNMTANTSTNNAMTNPTPMAAALLAQHQAEEEEEKQRMNLQIEKQQQLLLIQYQKEQLELNRREAIVNVASQAMIPVISSSSHQHQQYNIAGGYYGTNNTNNSSNNTSTTSLVNTYYDPIYAANAAQDILQFAARTRGMKLNLHNHEHNEDSVVTRAAYYISPLGILPQSSNFMDGTPTATVTTTSSAHVTAMSKKTVSSLLLQQQQQNNNYTDMNDMAETMIEELVPSNMILFGGSCPCIVENLP